MSNIVDHGRRRTGEAGSGWLWFWGVAGLVVCLAAVTSQSLWIDEALTAAKASAGSVGDWWQAMLADRASDLQMPLYMIYVWGWAKVFGTSEWALRMANGPWFIAGVVAIGAAVRGRRGGVLAAVVLSAPFAWYYLDEARPYAMQIGASLLVFAALLRLGESGGELRLEEGRWVVVFLVGVIALSGSSLLGMIWAGGACLCAGVIFPGGRMVAMARSKWAACACAAGMLTAILIYYLWTLKMGARASDVGKTDGRNVGFIVYELLGFSGLGPGRLQIREEGFRAFRKFIPLLALYGVVVAGLLALGVRVVMRKMSRRTLVGLGLAVGAPIVMILGAGVVLHFRVLGRHFAPLMVVVSGLVWLGCDECLARRKWFCLGGVYAFIGLSVASGYEFRVAPWQQKDDYRDASAVAIAALKSHQTVWWNADRQGAIYYHLPVTEDSREPSGAFYLMNPSAETLTALPVPDVVVASKPDVFDGRGALALFLEQHGFAKTEQLPAFTVWRRKP